MNKKEKIQKSVKNSVKNRFREFVSLQNFGQNV